MKLSDIHTGVAYAYYPQRELQYASIACAVILDKQVYHVTSPRWNPSATKPVPAHKGARMGGKYSSKIGLLAVLVPVYGGAPHDAATVAVYEAKVRKLASVEKFREHERVRDTVPGDDGEYPVVGTYIVVTSLSALHGPYLESVEAQQKLVRERRKLQEERDRKDQARLDRYNAVRARLAKLGVDLPEMASWRLAPDKVALTYDQAEELLRLAEAGYRQEQQFAAAQNAVAAASIALACDRVT